MSKDNNLIFKNSAILYFRLIVTSIISLISSRFILEALGESDFGLYSVVGGIVVLMAFLNSVMMATTNRFIAFEIGKGINGSINKIFNISLVIHICIALLVLVLTETIGVYYVFNYLSIDPNKITDALFVLRFSTYATFFSIISIPFQGLITAQEKFAVRATIEIIRSFLGLLAAISIIYYLGNKLKLYALIIALSNLVPPLLFYLYCKRKYHKFSKWNFQKDKSKYIEMINFSAWNMIGASAHFGKTTGSILIVNSFFGTVLNAAYAIANQLNSVVLMFSMNLAQAAVPQIIKSYSSGDSNRTINLAAYISKYTWFMMALPALPILLETEFLLNLWLGDYPQYTVVFCQFMIITTLISGLGNGLNAVVEATGKIKYFQIILSTTTLISLPIAFFLFDIGYPPKTILIVFMITTSINVVSSQILLKVIINFDIIYFLRTSYMRVFFVAVISSPLFFIHSLYPSNLNRFILSTIFATAWLILSIYLVGLERKEKNILHRLIKQTLKK